jgi:hypothetical protein
MIEDNGCGLVIYGATRIVFLLCVVSPSRVAIELMLMDVSSHAAS